MNVEKYELEQHITVLEARLRCVHKQNECLRIQVADYARFFNVKVSDVNDISTARKMLAHYFSEIEKLSQENKDLRAEARKPNHIIYTSTNSGGFNMTGNHQQLTTLPTQQDIENFFGRVRAGGLQRHGIFERP